MQKIQSCNKVLDGNSAVSTKSDPKRDKTKGTNLCKLIKDCETDLGKSRVGLRNLAARF